MLDEPNYMRPVFQPLIEDAQRSSARRAAGDSAAEITDGDRAQLFVTAVLNGIFVDARPSTVPADQRTGQYVDERPLLSTLHTWMDPGNLPVIADKSELRKVVDKAVRAVPRQQHRGADFDADAANEEEAAPPTVQVRVRVHTDSDRRVYALRKCSPMRISEHLRMLLPADSN